MIAPPKPPAHDELEALIKEARARQLRRRLFGAAAVAIVAAIALGAYAVTTSGPSRLNHRSTQAGRAAPRCQPSQLSVAAGWDGAAGNLFNFFTIINEGVGACSLPGGRPNVVLLRHGSPLKVEEQVPSNSYPGKPVSSLAPGRRAVVHLNWSNWCGPQVPYARTTTTVVVRFAGGIRVMARPSLEQPPCVDAAQPSVITVSRLMTLN